MKVKWTSVLLSVVLLGAGIVSAQNEWVDYPGNPVLGPGEPGAWDEGGR